MSRDFFKVGPFSEVEERLEDFTSSLYLQKLYMETVMQMIETQEAYDNAITENDSDEAKTLKTQLDFLENVVSLANNNMSSFISNTIYYD